MYTPAAKYLCSVYKEVWPAMIAKSEHDAEVPRHCCYVYLVFIVVAHPGYYTSYNTHVYTHVHVRVRFSMFSSLVLLRTFITTYNPPGIS